MSAQRRSLVRTSVLAAVVLLAAASCGDDGDDGGAATDAGNEATGPAIDESLIGEVQTFDVSAMDGCEFGDDGVDHCVHVEEIVDYDQTPPVGGAHAHFPQTCRFWDEPLFNEPAVHSLEHGAVWITYDPDLPEDQLDIIRDMAEHPQVMASPWTDSGHPTPVVLSAWGRQLWLEALPDPAAQQFLDDFVAHPDAPKPDAGCTQGYEGTRTNPR